MKKWEKPSSLMLVSDDSYSNCECIPSLIVNLVGFFKGIMHGLKFLREPSTNTPSLLYSFNKLFHNEFCKL